MTYLGESEFIEKFGFKPQDLDVYDTLCHHGVAHDENPPGRGSGRYAYGSGLNPHQHPHDWLTRYKALVESGLPEEAIAKEMGLYKTDWKGQIILNDDGTPAEGSTTKVRSAHTRAIDAVKLEEYRLVHKYYGKTNDETKKKYTVSDIVKETGLTRSKVDALISGKTVEKVFRHEEALQKIKDMLEQDGNYINVGNEAAIHLGLSEQELKVVREMLEDDGYVIQNTQISLGSRNKKQTATVVCKEEYADELWKHKNEILSIDPDTNAKVQAYKQGEAFKPNYISQDRVKILYDEQGGTDRDGMVQIKAYKDANGELHAVNPDLDLGNAKYGQVRIAVEGDLYIKGMAVYSTDEKLFGDGQDIVVNSNKSMSKGIEGALKPMYSDKAKLSPFGSNTVPVYYEVDDKGQIISAQPKGQFDQIKSTSKQSAINFVGSTAGDAHLEGSWVNWSKDVPSQFASKQSLPLVKYVLNGKYEQLYSQYQEALQINNPVVKAKALKDFADGCDAAAVDLKGCSLPGEEVNVLLSVPSLKRDEIYAPKYPNGTKVACIRYPHTGRWEVVVATVNNNNKEAQAMLKDSRGQAIDAVGMNPKAEGKLSGADNDGDTTYTIPLTKLTKTNNGSEREFTSTGIKIYDADTLKWKDKEGHVCRLDEFNPTDAWGESGYMNKRLGVTKYKHIRSEGEKGIKMGTSTNLITDAMGAGCQDEGELYRMVAFSMVVIDSKKHKLNLKGAYDYYGIKELQEKYQTNPQTGKSGAASTILSRAKNQRDVPLRKDSYKIDPETGERIWQYIINPETGKTPTEKVRRAVKVAAPKGYTYEDPITGEKKSSKWLKDEWGADVKARDAKGNVIYEDVIDPKTGEVKTKPRTTKSNQMTEAKDARQLLSANPSQIEMTYADFANKCKALANTARLDYISVPTYKKDTQAQKEYAAEYASVMEKYNRALKNTTRETAARQLQSKITKAKLDSMDSEDLSAEEYKKINSAALKEARQAVGAHKDRIVFTEKEWYAITEKHIVSATTLEKMLKHADDDNIRKLAYPKSSPITPQKIAQIKKLASKGRNYEDIASMMGFEVSMSMVANVVAGKYDE